MINLFKRKSWKWSIAGIVIIALIGITCLANPITTLGDSNKTQDKTNISGNVLEPESNNKNLVSKEVNPTEKLVKDENNKNNIPPKTAKVNSKVKLHEGTYWDERCLGDNDLELKNYCEVVISNVTNISFDFTVYEVDRKTKNRKVIFLKNTAAFTGDGMKATFNGNNHTLNFTFPSVTEIQISGFKPLEGKTYLNNRIPGHECS